MSRMGLRAMTQDSSTPVTIDASTFKRPLEELAIALTNKVEREGPHLVPTPPYLVMDVGILLRHSVYTYDLLFYLNADEKRNHDSDWREAYSFSVLSVIRSMIDALYNATALLDNPGTNAYWFRASGYRQLLLGLDEDEAQYGGDPKWDAYIAESRANLRLEMRALKFDEAQVLQQAFWPTLGKYLQSSKGKMSTPHQIFLRTLVHGFWREYSGISHATFAGLKTNGQFYVRDITPYDRRDYVDDYGHRLRSMHLSRAAVILLATVTEIQAYFRFDGANINQRIRQIWGALVPILEVKELYDRRYAQLMTDKGI
jgi:hypothetical protein